MMSKIKHLLLTRFAVRFEQGDIRARYELDPNWLLKRFELFERYTLPSVKVQTNSNFDWVLIVDCEFNNLDKERLKSYGIEIAWISGVYWDQYRYSDIVRAYAVEYDWVITSRLDSDDMICCTYINDVQEAFDYQKVWFSHEKGYMIKDDRAYPRKFPNSPFVSYAEPVDKAVGVYHVSHMKAGYDSPLVLIGGNSPGWAQVDHGDNIKNSVERNGLRVWVPVCELRERFGNIL